MSRQPCAVCSEPTKSLCGACEAEYFCSRNCQKALFATHRWLCSKLKEQQKAFSFAPLDDKEFAYLRDLIKTGRRLSRVHWPSILKQMKLWEGLSEVRLLRRLQDPSLTAIEEPRRSLILAELRGILVRAAPMVGYDYYRPSPWAWVGAYYRGLTRFGPEVVKDSKNSLKLLRPVLKAALDFATLEAAKLKREKEEKEDVKGKRRDSGLSSTDLEEYSKNAAHGVYFEIVRLELGKESTEALFRTTQQSLFLWMEFGQFARA